MKKVLVVSPQPFFSPRGTPINVRAVVSTLSRAGYEVTLLTLPFGEESPVEGVRVVRAGRIPFLRELPIGVSITKLIYNFSLFFKLWRLTGKEKFDLFHGVEEGAFLVGTIGKYRSVPYLIDVDSCMSTQVKDSSFGKIPGVAELFSKFESYFTRKSVAAITVCDALTEKVRKCSPITPIYQIEDFPFADALVVDSQKYQELSARFGANRVLLYTGNLESYQGVELLIRSYAMTLPAVRSETVVAIVGGTEQQIAELKELAIYLGVGSFVKFEGRRPASEMGAYTAMSSFLLSPRITGENVPLKLYTYLASEKPLIATRISSHTQIVTDKSSFLGEATVSGYSQAISRALSADAQHLRAVAAKGRELIDSRYSQAHFEKRLLDTYQALLPISPPIDAAHEQRSF